MTHFVVRCRHLHHIAGKHAAHHYTRSVNTLVVSVRSTRNARYGRKLTVNEI